MTALMLTAFLAVQAGAAAQEQKPAPESGSAATGKPAAPGHESASGTAPAYVPERVYDTERRAFSDFEVMLADLVSADVVFVGEQHGNPGTHRLELALVDGLRRRGVPITLSLEMFERDVQGVLDRYLRGTLPEREFLADARPWPRYGTDYRPIVELARTHGWPVVAANVPRRLASEVAKSGKDRLEQLAPADRAMAAKELDCPADAYFERFAKAMGEHAGSAKEGSQPAEATGTADAERTDRYYWSQCLKDETMAESIAGAFEARPDRRGVVVHLNGAFHSDFGMGAAARVRRRLPGRRIAVVSILPVTDLDALAPSGDDLGRAEYLVYTIK